MGRGGGLAVTRGKRWMEKKDWEDGVNKWMGMTVRGWLVG